MDQINIQSSLNICYEVYGLYSNILNSYVSDYYLEDHWKKLSPSWQFFFNNINISELSNILDFSKPVENHLCPLSLLCLKNIIMNYTLSRKIELLNLSSFLDNKFMNFFSKNVKLKKRHEINEFAKLCYETTQKTNCVNIVDIGSGLGHLSRMLSYGYGLRVCTFEAVEELVQLAIKLDTNFEDSLNKRNIPHRKIFKTVHINQRITEEFVKSEFLELVTKAFNVDYSVKFGIVGLHPCGDLGGVLLKLFTHCPNIVFINIASCCYMKLTLNTLRNSYFPLSRFCHKKHFTISYLACEIACHAIENYSEKLRHAEEHEKLKIHAYRAALEDILVSADPKLKHSMVCGAKCDKNLTFQNYVEKVCDKLHILPRDKILLYENVIAESWYRVVTFYSVRLLLAPLVENIILLDRLLYVLESGYQCTISPLFDCKISPRNQVLSAIKIKD